MRPRNHVSLSNRHKQYGNRTYHNHTVTLLIPAPFAGKVEINFDGMDGKTQLLKMSPRDARKFAEQILVAVERCEWDSGAVRREANVASAS